MLPTVVYLLSTLWDIDIALAVVAEDIGMERQPTMGTDDTCSAPLRLDCMLLVYLLRFATHRASAAVHGTLRRRNPPRTFYCFGPRLTTFSSALPARTDRCVSPRLADVIAVHCHTGYHCLPAIAEHPQ